MRKLPKVSMSLLHIVDQLRNYVMKKARMVWNTFLIIALWFLWLEAAVKEVS